MIIMAVEMWIIFQLEIWKIELSNLINRQMWIMLIVTDGF